MKDKLTVIIDKDDWSKFYCYKTSKKIPYPKKYPCIAKIEHEDCGLMGSAYFHYVVYLPESYWIMNAMDLAVFMLEQEWNCIV